MKFGCIRARLCMLMMLLDEKMEEDASSYQDEKLSFAVFVKHNNVMGKPS